MFFAPGPSEVLRDLLHGLVTSVVAMLGQIRRISVAGDNRPDDGHAGRAGEVRDGAMHLDVHLVERLLHPLDTATALDDEVGHLAVQSSHPGDRFVRPERATEQPAAVQELDPLAVAEVGLPSRHVVERSSVDEHDLDAARFEQLVDRDPVDVRALHGHRLHALLGEPVRERVQLDGRRAEHPNVRGLALRWSANPVLCAADIDAGDQRLDHWQRGRRRPRLLLPLATSIGIRHVDLVRRLVPTRGGSDCGL